MAVIASYYVAKSHEALKQFERAREIYQKIVKEHLGVIWVDFAKARLKELPAGAASPPGSS